MLRAHPPRAITDDTIGHDGRPFTFAHLSDLHAGSPYFVPNLMDRAVVELNELRPHVVAVTGDLTNEGFKQEFAVAKSYLERLECPHVLVIPGNHDSRNVGYVHFEQLFGPRSVVLHTGDISIVGVDSTEPDLDYGTIGRSRYAWLEPSSSPCRHVFASSCCTITCCPSRAPAVSATWSTTPATRSRCCRPARSTSCCPVTNTCRTPGISKNMFVVNAGTVCSLRLRGDTRPCYNIVTIEDDRVRVVRKYPFHGAETIIEFSPSTLHYDKFSAEPQGRDLGL